MTKPERIAAVLAVTTFYLGSVLIAAQWVNADALEEAAYQQELAQGYRAVVLDNVGVTEASLAVCETARVELEAEVRARRPQRMVGR